MWTVLYVLGGIGMIVGAGYAGGFVAEHVQERERSISNVGFLSGAAGGLFVTVWAAAAWWGGHLSFH